MLVFRADKLVKVILIGLKTDVSNKNCPLGIEPPKAANNVFFNKETSSDINPKQQESEPVTQIQTDSVITQQDLLDRRPQINLNLIVLAIFLFIAAIYYGIINP